MCQINDQKRGTHVVDDCSDTDNSMAAGIGEWLYYGLFYSYPSGHCHYHGIDQNHTGAETNITY